MKHYYLLIALLFYGFLAVDAQPYIFELDSTTYTPIDTNNAKSTIHGYQPWANSVNSSQVVLPFVFPFLSRFHKIIYYTAAGSIMLFTGAGFNDRIELFNCFNHLDSNSYVTDLVDTSGPVSFFHIEYSNLRLDTDSNVYFSFQGKLYEDGMVEVIIGPSNLNYALNPDSAFYVGLDSGIFAWSYFLTGDPNAPTVVEGDPDVNLLEIPKSGTIYRFKYDDGSVVSHSGPIGLEVYPNPVKDLLTVEFGHDESARLQLFSIDGALLLEAPSAPFHQIDLREVNRGVYWLRMESEARVVTHRIIKR